MDIQSALSAQLVHSMPYGCLVEVMSPFLNAAALEELVVIAFHLRNVRGGAGQRQLFRDMMSVFYEYDRTLVTMLLPHVPEYGYWKDIFYLSMTLPYLLAPTMSLCKQQLLEDEYRVRLGYQPSYMAKYMPKQKKKYKSFANSFAKFLYPEIECHSLRMAKMRKRISALNTATVEVKMCANTWSSIEPSQVPLIAGKKYEDALLNRRSDGSVRSLLEDREVCREKFQHFLDRARTPREALNLNVQSEKYEPVRLAVRDWLTHSLNTIL